MPSVTLGGIKCTYDVTGEGIPLIMLSPGGFDSTIEGTVKAWILDSVAAGEKARKAG